MTEGYNATEYQRDAARTLPPSIGLDERLTLAALGMTGESGEFADMIKKWKFHGHELDRQALVKEIGDVLWYCAAAATALNVTLDYVMATNIQKLRKRYPDGFSSEASINRKE